MKNWDLNVYGVSELSTLEMRNAEGGFWGFLAGYLFGEYLNAVIDTARGDRSDFEQGRAAAKRLLDY